MQSLPLADPGTPDLRSPVRLLLGVARRHTASDADRVAVVEDGRVTELGSHEEPLAGGGSYAALWASWQSDGAPPAVA